MCVCLPSPWPRAGTDPESGLRKTLWGSVTGDAWGELLAERQPQAPRPCRPLQPPECSPTEHRMCSAPGVACGDSALLSRVLCWLGFWLSTGPERKWEGWGTMRSGLPWGGEGSCRQQEGRPCKLRRTALRLFRDENTCMSLKHIATLFQKAPR